MANITSSAPAAYSALWGLVSTAAQFAGVQLFPFELEQYEPGSYVMLTGIENHRFEIASIGSYANEETFDLVGKVSVFEGTIDPNAVITATYNVFQTVVMDVVVANRGHGGNILGISSGPAPVQIVPGYARYSATPGNLGGGQAGFQGTVDWSFSCLARLTVT